MTDPEIEVTGTPKFWLDLQVALGLSGGVIWFAGAALEQEFVAGVGCGFIASALILRLGRASARREASSRGPT